MTKSTRDISTCFVFKSSPEAFISPVFQKFFYPGRGTMPPSKTFPPFGSNAPSHYLACTWIFT